MDNLLKLIFTLAVMVVVVATAQLGPLTTFEAFKAHYGKTYNSEEHEGLASYWFEKNSDLVTTHNARFEEGLETYSMKINEFTDQDPVEFHRGRQGAVLDSTLPSAGGHYGIDNDTTTVEISVDTSVPLPDVFDWTSQGKVSPVKNQGQCGSCWAFSAMGAIESGVLMAVGDIIPLSEEQLVDCYRQSCQGADQRNAWLWLVKQSDGAVSSESYPYTAGNTGKAGECASATAQVVQQITGYNQLTMPTNDDTLKRYLVQNGPLSVDVDASGWSQNYGKGVLSCVTPKLNHAVILTGWGSDDKGKDYWIIKNSWNTGWGQEGFGWVAMGQNVDCGITQWVAAVPTLKTVNDIIICEFDPNPMNLFSPILFILVGSIGVLAAAMVVLTIRARQVSPPPYKNVQHHFAPSSFKSSSVLSVVLVHGGHSNISSEA